MFGVALLAVFAGTLVAVVAAVRQGPKLSADSLLGALSASGLQPVTLAPRSGWMARFGVVARADVGAHRLIARLYSDGSKRGPRVSLELDAGLDPSLTLQVHFGEQTWWVLGDEALAAALATGRVRSAAGPGDQLHIVDGTVSLLSHDPLGAGEGVEALREIARRLRGPNGPRDTERLLIETAFEDSAPRARAEAVGFLLGSRPELAKTLARDRAPEVRLAVARWQRGELGFELASEILTSEIFHAEIQQAALRYLLSSHGPEQVGPVLVGALGAADDNLQGALVTALAALGHAGAASALYSELPTAELRNAARIAEALEQLEGSAAEPALTALLDRLPATGPALQDERELATSVADALGRIGGQGCLASLRALALRVPPDSSEGIAIKVAVDLVRARTGAPDLTGALALSGASPVEGRLSTPSPSRGDEDSARMRA